LNFFDPNMMNITIWHKIYCPYPNLIREFSSRKKNYLYLYLQYPFVSDLFSSVPHTSPCWTEAAWLTIYPLSRLFAWMVRDRNRGTSLGFACSSTTVSLVQFC
jgi:hypothetical protein